MAKTEYRLCMIEVLFFGRMVDAAGMRHTSLPHSEGLRLSDIRVRLLPDMDGVRMSVNKVQVVGDQALHDGDEVAFFSVFSGG